MHKYTIIMTILLVALVTPARALKVPPQPGSGNFIADTVDIISAPDEAFIRNTIAKLYRDQQIPIVVVTINKLLNYMDEEYIGIEAYSKKLFNHWGIGHKSHNYGVLLLVSRDDKVARIQFGGGWGFLYDSQAQDIMDNTMIPYFQTGDYSDGIRAGVVELNKLARIELEFLVDEQRVLSVIAAFTVLVICFQLLMMKNIDHPKLLFHKAYAIAIGFFYLVVLLQYKYGFLNHIELYFTVFGCILVTLASLAVYAPFYAKTNTKTKTALHLLVLLLIMVFIPVFMLFWIAIWARASHEYGDGNADMGGGATGMWGGGDGGGD